MTANPCPRTGEEKRTCKCSSCIGRRNRAAGARKATAWWNAMGAQPEKWAGRAVNEETRTAEWRAEVKSGKQVAKLGEGWDRAVGYAQPFPGRVLVLCPAYAPFPDRLYVFRISAVRSLTTEPVHIYHCGGRAAKIWVTAYTNARRQSDDAAIPDDPRPFVFGVMPPGTSDGFAVVKTGDWPKLKEALLAEWAKG